MKLMSYEKRKLKSATSPFLDFSIIIKAVSQATDLWVGV